MLFDFCYSILLLDIGYIISDSWYLTPWYLQSKTLIHATCFLPNVNWYLILTEEAILFFYMILKPSITCKKIVSFRSCRATRSCLCLTPLCHGKPREGSVQKWFYLFWSHPNPPLKKSCVICTVPGLESVKKLCLCCIS